jgi:hypothetical protein
MLLEHQRTILISIAFGRLLNHGQIPSVVVEATRFRILSCTLMSPRRTL